ncbi:twin-arginine translocation signal domain-containing protein [Microlunatus parietis]|uniref:Lipoprotein n=1 Tax=Microlunatus parietis TaxID=682979 RepID=A0A7Y9I4C7_9ACTN|nr:twin-arginine translocation signal domain-containing protein [Microlunatus parietis]NYE69942.1 hypothetical protein [Microlunatus parietis]
MMITRRGFHRRAGLLIAALGTTTAGCALLPPEPLPLTRFGAFTMTVTGGVAGVFRQLQVTPSDRIGLVLTERPAAGRISTETLNRIGTLLESEAFRREAARPRPDDMRCADTFVVTLRMGALTVSREDPCAPTPAPEWDKLTALLQPFWEGRFEEPLPAASAPPILVQEIASGRPTGRRAELGPDGQATLRSPDRVLRTGRLEVSQLAALTVLAARPLCRPAREFDDGFLISIGDQQAAAPVGNRIGPDCPELGAIAQLARTAVHL